MRVMVTRLAAAFATLALAVSLTAANAPKNVILVIGDGMGAAHFSAARIIRGDAFRIGTMPVVGLTATSPADRTVTDSAAAATAYSTGFRTNYEMLGVDPSGTPHQTLLELAESEGRSTGLVTTAAFYDATPASFAAHSLHRKRYPEVIAGMLQSGADLIVGSGLQKFGTDGIPPLAEMTAKNGYVVESTLDGIRRSPAAKVLALFEGQTNDAEFPNAKLADLTRVAIERLSTDPDGFFLLVESEGTDTGSHNNNSIAVQAAVTAVDEVAGVALDFAARDGNTLVIVTGDHETGGLRISEARDGSFRMEWSTTEHTASAVPLFAFGPGAERFAGFHDNFEVGRLLLATERVVTPAAH